MDIAVFGLIAEANENRKKCVLKEALMKHLSTLAN